MMSAYKQDLNNHSRLLASESVVATKICSSIAMIKTCRAVHVVLTIEHKTKNPPQL
jgi:hypothetical protein